MKKEEEEDKEEEKGRKKGKKHNSSSKKSLKSDVGLYRKTFEDIQVGIIQWGLHSTK